MCVPLHFFGLLCSSADRALRLTQQVPGSSGQESHTEQKGSSSTINGGCNLPFSKVASAASNFCSQAVHMGPQVRSMQPSGALGGGAGIILPILRLLLGGLAPDPLGFGPPCWCVRRWGKGRMHGEGELCMQVWWDMCAPFAPRVYCVCSWLAMCVLRCLCSHRSTLASKCWGCSGPVWLPFSPTAWHTRTHMHWLLLS